MAVEARSHTVITSLPTVCCSAKSAIAWAASSSGYVLRTGTLSRPVTTRAASGSRGARVPLALGGGQQLRGVAVGVATPPPPALVPSPRRAARRDQRAPLADESRHRGEPI